MKAAALPLLVLLVGGLLVPASPAQAAEETRPLGLRNAVYSASASGPDGSRIYVSVLWDDMPTRLGLPTHNADRTFYPGDALRVRIAGSHSGGYEDMVAISGAVESKTVGAGGTFDLKEDLQVRTSVGPGLQDINFTLFPRNGVVVVTVVDEEGRFSGSRGVYANGSFLGAGTGTYSLGQGEYTISFDPPPENVLAPPSVKITLTPARRLSIVAYYQCSADNVQPRTDVAVLEQGAATFLPTLTAALRIYVVPYNPRFVVIPYLCIGTPAQSSYEMPFAVLVRYDGNQYDPENENRLSLDQRVLLDGVSMSGHASWPLRSEGVQQRYHDNGELSFLENGDPEMYADLEELRYDNGMPKLEIATVTVNFDRIVTPGGYFNLLARYSYPENVKEQYYTHEEAFGTGPFGWLNFHDVQVTGETKLGDEWRYEFLTAEGGPIVFDRNYRYHKFVFTLQNDALMWIAAGEGTLALDLSFWSTSNSGRAIRTGIEWGPLGLRQSVQVTAWRLAPWAREAAEENAQVLYLDDAWMVDYRVRFDLSFVSVFDAENFLFTARDYARVAAPFVKEFLGASWENLKNVLDNALKFIPPELRSLVTGLNLREMLPAVNASLYSIANLDNYMIGVIVEDTGLDNRDPQHISGTGQENAVVERRGLTYFAVEGRAWFTEENARSRQEMVDLPFDNKTAYGFDINLSGEGMVAEVVSDTASRLELRIHAPPRSGGLQSVRILDNEGNLLYQQDFPSSSLAQLLSLGSFFGVSAAAPTEAAKTLTFDKTPSTPTEIYVELTNAWEASRTQKLTVAPWVPVTGVEMNIWGWLIAAGIFAAAWVAFVNWMRERKSSQLARGFAP